MGIRIGLGLSPVLAADRLPWTPGELSSLRAWYDAELGQPKYGGDAAYVQLDGTSGDYVFTPDSAALDALDGDIEVVMRVWCANWATGSTQTLAGRYVSSGNQRCFRFYTSGAGAIGLSGSPDGTSGALVTPSVTPTNPLPTSTWFWLRMRLDLSNGSNSVGSIDTAADTGSNYLEPVSWTANGSGTAAVISGIFTGTAPLEIGSFSNGTLERFTGRVGRVIARDGFDGTTVADFNADDCYGDGYWHTGGYRWSLGLPKIYDRGPNGLAPATFGSGSNQPQWLPWTGRSQVYFPGTSGNVVEAGNVDHTGDYTARVHFNFRSIGTDFSELVSDRSSSVGEATFRLTGGTGLLTKLNHLWWESGVPKQQDSSAHGLIDGQDAWVGVERINNSGGVYRIRFYKSLAESPSMTDWTGWTLISESVGGAVAAPSVSTSLTYIGGAATVYTGGIYRVVTTNNGSTVIDFAAASCGQAGYGPYTVLRATSGRKTVVQSPVANSARSDIAIGPDDHINIPVAAIPPSTAADSFSVATTAREWATPQGNQRFFDDNPGAGGGLLIYSNSTTSGINARLGDTVPNLALAAIASTTLGQRLAITAVAEAQEADGLRLYVNQQTATPQSLATIGDRPVAASPAIGKIATGSSGYADIEWEAIAFFDRDLTDIEHGLWAAYYKAGT